MNSVINAGIVGCTMAEEYFQYIANASPEKINYKKTLFSGVASSSKFAWPRENREFSKIF